MIKGPAWFPSDVPVQALTAPSGDEDLRTAIDWREAALVSTKWRRTATDKVGVYSLPVAVIFLLAGVYIAAGLVAMISMATLVYGEVLADREARITGRINSDKATLAALEGRS